MGTRHTKQLLVEGKDDQFAIAGLMRAHTPWGDSADEWPVFIKPLDGVESLLAEGSISTHWKSSGLTHLGIVVDANEEFDGRWARLSDLCGSLVAEFPKALPTNGLVRSDTEGKRLGIWIMPDNRSRGMLETFLRFLVPGTDDPLWTYARTAAKHARSKGAPYSQVHFDKAAIHTWLAWQDEPGPPLGLALIRKCLDPESDQARPFVEWFKELFELP